MLQDFRKLSVGQKVEFKINPTPEYPSTDVEHIKIDIIINGEVVGYVHDVNYIRPDRVVSKDDNLARNKEELIALRKSIVGEQSSDIKSKIDEIEKRRKENKIKLIPKISKDGDIIELIDFNFGLIQLSKQNDGS